MHAEAGIASARLASGRAVEAESRALALIDAGAPPELAGALWRCAVRAILFQGRMSDARRAAEAAASCAGLGDEDRADLLALLATAIVMDGDPSFAEEAGHRAEHTARASGNRGALVRSLVARGQLAGSGGRLAECETLLGEAVQLSEAEGTRDSHECFAHALYALTLADSDRFDQAALAALAAAGGDPAAAKKLLWEAWAVALGAGLAMDCVVIGSDLADISALVGDPGEEIAVVADELGAVAARNPDAQRQQRQDQRLQHRVLRRAGARHRRWGHRRAPRGHRGGRQQSHTRTLAHSHTRAQRIRRRRLQRRQAGGVRLDVHQRLRSQLRRWRCYRQRVCRHRHLDRAAHHLPR